MNSYSYSISQTILLSICCFEPCASAFASAKPIYSINITDDGATLALQMNGRFTAGSHQGFYVDADSDLGTGYKGGVQEIIGADYLVQSNGVYRYPDGSHGWKWVKISSDSHMEANSTLVKAHIPLELLNTENTIRCMAIFSSSDWRQNTFSPWKKHHLKKQRNEIDYASLTEMNDVLNLKIGGRFSKDSRFVFYIDSDNNPNTGYTNGSLNGMDYLIQSDELYRYPTDADGWKWDYLTNDISFTKSSSKITVKLPLDKIAHTDTINFVATVLDRNWKNTVVYNDKQTLSLSSGSSNSGVENVHRIYVDGATGDDSHPGTQSLPMKSIQAAINHAKPGETVFIKRGIYHEELEFPVSGEIGKPIVIQGEKDALGNKLVRVHGGERITVKWQRADEIGNGVYKIAGLPDSYAMTVLQDGVFKDIPRLGSDTVRNRFDRMHLLGEQQETGESYTYKDILALPGDAEFKTQYTKMNIKYWDGIEALYTYDNGITYIRFRGGENPNDMEIFRAGGENNKFGAMRDILLSSNLQESATFKLHNRSYITIKDLNIDGSQNGVLVYGRDSHNNIIENNDIVNGQRRVFIAQLAHDNVIRNNRMHMELLSDYRPGAWYGAQRLNKDKQLYQYAVAEHIYYTYKHEIGFQTYSPLDDCGVFVNSAGGGNDIYSNEIYDTLGGVLGYQIGYIKIHNNTFHHISSVATGLGNGPTYIYKNKFYNVHIGFRSQLVSQEKTDLRGWFFENIFYNPARLSEGIFLSVNSNLQLPRREDEYANIYIYHNTFVNTGRDNQATANNLSKNVVFVNNLLYQSFLSVDGTGEIGYVDYNWFGEPNIYSDGSPHPYREHNIENPLDKPWNLPEAFPDRILDFTLPPDSSARHAGIDLSKPFVLNGTVFEPLYGMKQGYFKGDKPNIGAIQ